MIKLLKFPFVTAIWYNVNESIRYENNEATIAIRYDLNTCSLRYGLMQGAAL